MSPIFFLAVVQSGCLLYKSSSYLAISGSRDMSLLRSSDRYVHGVFPKREMAFFPVKGVNRHWCHCPSHTVHLFVLSPTNMGLGLLTAMKSQAVQLSRIRLLRDADVAVM